MSPIIRECERRGLDFFVLHTGQHYSYEMDGAFFEQLELPAPKYNLNVGSGTHAEQTGKIMMGVEKVLLDEEPDVVLVQGDTNTVLAGALAACKLHIPVGHVEAGLRSFDRNMPEEINRIVADHVSDYLYAPTETSKSNLLREGIPEEKILVSGNTVVDAIKQNIALALKKKEPLSAYSVSEEEYFLVTLHRVENVDDPIRFETILKSLKEIGRLFYLPVLFFIHPRSEKMVKSFNLDTGGITLLPPCGYLDFILLELKAKLVLTDSGGVQEECCVLGTPCVTLRDNTERPETISVGSNLLAGANIDAIVRSVEAMIGKRGNWRNPFGDGRAGEFILNHLTHLVE
jgi:UDP-N-acetylglucosamine 2-epimerase (non-hydrolysing)